MSSSDTITIGMLRPDQWREYRDIWLEALKKTPEAFFPSFEQQREQSDEVWQDRLRNVIAGEDIIMVFALKGHDPIGFLGAYFDDNPKFAHIAFIWGAYVQEHFRRQGVARRMMEAFLEKLLEKDGITKIKTYSVTNELMAVNVYKSFHFDLVGIMKNEMKVGDKYLNVYIMEKQLQ